MWADRSRSNTPKKDSRFQRPSLLVKRLFRVGSSIRAYLIMIATSICRHQSHLKGRFKVITGDSNTCPLLCLVITRPCIQVSSHNTLTTPWVTPMHPRSVLVAPALQSLSPFPKRNRPGKAASYLRMDSIKLGSLKTGCLRMLHRESLYQGWPSLLTVQLQLSITQQCHHRQRCSIL